MKLNRRPWKKLNYNTPGKMFLIKFDNIIALASWIFAYGRIFSIKK
jgi:hypothetical protein